MVQFRLERLVSAPRDQVFDYYTRITDLPSLHPDYFKSVRLMSKHGTEATVEVESQFSMKRLKSTNRMRFYPPSRIESETIEGDGKGSRVVWSFEESLGGTRITVESDIKLGLLSSLLSSVLKNLGERMMDEDLKSISEGYQPSS